MTQDTHTLPEIAVGRRNWTFLGKRSRRKTMTILSSFVSLCEMNKIDPLARFHDVLAGVPAHSIQKLDQLLHRIGPREPANTLSSLEGNTSSTFFGVYVLLITHKF